MKPLAERALDQLVLSNMNADREWLVQNSSTSYSYWLNSLETRIESETNRDRSVKLKAQTIIATGIEDAKLAERICVVLNYYAISWAFAYDYADKSIKALSAVHIYVHEVDEPYLGVLEPSPFQDGWIILLCNSIWGQATIAGDLADVVAKLSGGVAAHTKPAHQESPRDVPDIFALIPDVLHQRPEWLRDYRPITHWPAFGEMASALQRSIEEEFEHGFSSTFTESREGGILDLSFEGTVMCQWVLTRVLDERYGLCMFSRQEFSRLPLYSDAEMANQANLIMFNHWEFNLLGTWTANEKTMFFASIIPSAFLRSLEDSSAKYALMNYSPGFFARLALRSHSAIKCIDTLLGNTGPQTSRFDEPFDYAEIFNAVSGAVDAPSTRAMSVAADLAEEGTTDPTLLRAKCDYQFFMIGVFSPIGPTIMSLEAFPTGSENEYDLVEMQRHPLYPKYVHLGRVLAGSPEFSAILEHAVESQFNWIPDYLDLSGCPQEVLPELTSLIKKRFLTLANELKIDVPKHFERLESITDDAWSRVDHNLLAIEEATTEATEADIETYFELITSADNLLIFWHAIPDAWDGALNYSLSNGILASTDVGPLMWTYNRQLGMLPN
jgi:hypothetical protein